MDRNIYIYTYIYSNLESQFYSNLEPTNNGLTMVT